MDLEITFSTQHGDTKRARFDAIVRHTNIAKFSVSKSIKFVVTTVIATYIESLKPQLAFILSKIAHRHVEILHGILLKNNHVDRMKKYTDLVSDLIGANSRIVYRKKS